MDLGRNDARVPRSVARVRHPARNGPPFAAGDGICMHAARQCISIMLKSGFESMNCFSCIAMDGWMDELNLINVDIDIDNSTTMHFNRSSTEH